MLALTIIRDLITQSIDEIAKYLTAQNSELKKTQFDETYIIKFTEKTNVNDVKMNPLRGLIFNAKTQQLISMTYPVPIEFKDLSPDAQASALMTISKQTYHVRDAFDGTLLRYSYFPDQQKWLLSTNSKEDANSAYWMNGVSFQKQFEEACQLDVSKLDKTHVYLFALCHPLNVIVVPHQKPHVYHITTYNLSTAQEVDVDIGLDKLVKYDLDLAGVISATASANEKPVRSAGYLVDYLDVDGWTHRYRFENANYTEAKKLRGSGNNVDFLLLSVMTSDTSDLFFEYFPCYIPKRDELKERMSRLTAKLYREYGARYKEHNDVNVHTRHHKFLGEIHQKVYRDTLKPVNQTVQYQDIYKFLGLQPPAKILYMLNYIYPEAPKSTPLTIHLLDDKSSSSS